MIFLVLTGLMLLLPLLWFVWLVSRAPDGYEDEAGFHFGDGRADGHDNRERSPARRLNPAAAGDTCFPDCADFEPASK
jgi:hypothetical protein